MNMNLSYSAIKNAGGNFDQIRFFQSACISALPERIWGSITARHLILRRTAMKKSDLFVGLLLGAMLSAVALSTPSVTGKWSGTLQMDGESDAKRADSILNQDGNKLSGSVRPNKSEQDSLEVGEVN